MNPYENPSPVPGVTFPQPPFAGWREFTPARRSELWQLGAFFVSDDDLRVVVSLEIKKDDRWWFHLSVSRSTVLPTWEDVRRAKETFMGDVHAIMILPTKEEYVNDHLYCLHLWWCLNGRPVVDMRTDEGSV